MRLGNLEPILQRGKRGFIVAIDGPSGAGKSTVSRQLAEVLGGRLLDTGAMYRSVAYFSMKERAQTERDCSRIAQGLKFSMDERKGGMLLVNGEDLGHRLRSPRVTQQSSLISRFASIRKILTTEQRLLAKHWSRRVPVVVEGRDIGTVVFPSVEFKFFVTADPEVRARRRYLQLKRQGSKGITFKEILKQHQQRDTQDSHRKIAPLRCPDDAVVVDTSSMGIAQVVRFMRDHIRGQINLPHFK